MRHTGGFFSLQNIVCFKPNTTWLNSASSWHDKSVLTRKLSRDSNYSSDGRYSCSCNELLCSLMSAQQNSLHMRNRFFTDCAKLQGHIIVLSAGWNKQHADNFFCSQSLSMSKYVGDATERAIRSLNWFIRFQMCSVDFTVICVDLVMGVCREWFLCVTTNDMIAPSKDHEQSLQISWKFN